MNDNPKVLNFYHLLNYCFNIPEYQRGYRWEKKQVEDLLNDLKDFIDKRSDKQEFYCLQPIVVYKTDEYKYDVIDGQQRLTTLYLILQALKNTIEENCDTQTIYQIGYSKYKNDPFENDYLNSNGFIDDDDRQYLTADNFFIRQAYVEIRRWFDNNKRCRVTFAQMLMNSDSNSTLPDNEKKDLRVIWYETTSGSKDCYNPIQLEKDSIEIFNRLNYGKIKLTDTELIKALILQSDCYKGDKYASMEQWTSKVAADWDNMEKKLHNPFFWSMLNAVEDINDPSHIGFILSFVAKDIYEENADNENFKKIKKDGHFDYVVIDRWLSKKESSREVLVKDLWNRVVDVYSLFESWYEDLEIYHRIGLLILFLERSKDRDNKVNRLIRSLYNQRSLSKSAFIEALREKIKSVVKITSKYKIDNVVKIHTLETVNYDDNSDEIIKILELVNVIDHLRKPNDESRFPFHLFKKYNVTSLEHIHPQNIDIDDMSFKEACSWLKRKEHELNQLQYLVDKNINHNAQNTAEKIKDNRLSLDEDVEDKVQREANKKADQEAANNYETSSDIKGLENKVNKKTVLDALDAAGKLKEFLVFLDEDVKDKVQREANKKANQEAAKKYKTSSEIKDLINNVDNVFDELAGMKETEMHSIKNLALVDMPTNSALQNYLLDTKRRILKERSEADESSDNHTFVPVTTELVFNKGFSKSVKELKFWTYSDREAYFKHIESIYNEFVK